MCVKLRENEKCNAHHFCDQFKQLVCIACHRDLRALISFPTYIYEIWTIKCTLPAEIRSLEVKLITTV